MEYLIVIFAIIVIGVDVLKTHLNRKSELENIKIIEGKNKELLRELVFAIKSQNTEEYAQSNIDDSELPGQEETDELMEISDVDPEQLLSAIRKIK